MLWESILIIISITNRFLNNENASSTIVLYGKPGTGKSHLLKIFSKKYFLNALKSNNVKNMVITAIKLISLNAINYITCYQLLEEISIRISVILEVKNKCNIKKSSNNLLNFIKKIINFKNKKNIRFIVLIDEIDICYKNDKDNFLYLYDFLDYKNTHLFNICVSNTFTIFEAADCNFELLNFKPFNVEDNTELITNLLSECINENEESLNDYITKDVIAYVCKRVYKINSGDIRALFSVIKLLIKKKIFELKTREEIEEVAITPTFMFLNLEDFEINYFNMYISLSLHSKLILLSIFIILKNNNKVDFDIKMLTKSLKEVCDELAFSDFISIEESLGQLEQYNFLVRVGKASVRLKIEMQDLKIILENDKLFLNLIN